MFSYPFGFELHSDSIQAFGLFVLSIRSTLYVPFNRANIDIWCINQGHMISCCCSPDCMPCQHPHRIFLDHYKNARSVGLRLKLHYVYNKIYPSTSVIHEKKKETIIIICIKIDYSTGYIFYFCHSISEFECFSIYSYE